MSAQGSDLGSAGHDAVSGDHLQDHAAAAARHPRSAGFRVLSRLARGRAGTGAAYAPRHRLGGDEEPGAPDTAVD
jgi:hypothetical protein